MPAQKIYVIDCSAALLLELGHSGVYSLGGLLDTLMANGRLAFPKAVYDEVVSRNGASVSPCIEWYRRNRGKGQFGEPDDIVVAEVLGIVPKAIDPSSRHEESAAAVLAVARTIDQLEEDVRIVSEDGKDKPNRRSLVACARVLNLKVAQIPELLLG